MARERLIKIEEVDLSNLQSITEFTQQRLRQLERSVTLQAFNVDWFFSLVDRINQQGKQEINKEIWSYIVTIWNSLLNAYLNDERVNNLSKNSLPYLQQQIILQVWEIRSRLVLTLWHDQATQQSNIPIKKHRQQVKYPQVKGGSWWWRLYSNNAGGSAWPAISKPVEIPPLKNIPLPIQNTRSPEKQALLEKEAKKIIDKPRENPVSLVRTNERIFTKEDQHISQEIFSIAVKVASSNKVKLTDIEISKIKIWEQFVVLISWENTLKNIDWKDIELDEIVLLFNQQKRWSTNSKRIIFLSNNNEKLLQEKIIEALANQKDNATSSNHKTSTSQPASNNSAAIEEFMGQNPDRVKIWKAPRVRNIPQRKKNITNQARWEEQSSSPGHVAPSDNNEPLTKEELLAVLLDADYKVAKQDELNEEETHKDTRDDKWESPEELSELEQIRQLLNQSFCNLRIINEFVTLWNHLWEKDNDNFRATTLEEYLVLENPSKKLSESEIPVIIPEWSIIASDLFWEYLNKLEWRERTILSAIKTRITNMPWWIDLKSFMVNYQKDWEWEFVLSIYWLPLSKRVEIKDFQNKMNKIIQDINWQYWINISINFIRWEIKESNWKTVLIRKS